MDHDCDMSGVVEGGGAAIERGIIEAPPRRSELPNQLGKIVPVFVISGAAALGGKIELIPPLQFGLWWQRHLAGFLAADQIAAYGNHRVEAFRPERGHDVGFTRSPVMAG